jgi:hypothetical protein
VRPDADPRAPAATADGDAAAGRDLEALWDA